MKTYGDIHSEGKNSLKTIDNISSGEGGSKSYKVNSVRTENNQSSSNHYTNEATSVY